MPDPQPQPSSKPGIHLAFALVLIAAFWALGNWAVKSQQLEWAMVALVAIVGAWAYAGLSFLKWIKK